MNEIMYLLKFGQRDHIDQFAAGSIYCSNAVTIRKIEKEIRIKGQGDILEGSSKVFAQRFSLYSHENDQLVFSAGMSNMLVHYVPADFIPVFCLFAVFERDCKEDDNGIPRINLSDTTKKVIREHFPNANAVAIIKNPSLFIENVRDTIGYEIKSELVHYFHIDNGYEAADGKQTAMDMDYMKYLVQDTPPKRGEGMVEYSFSANYVYRVLMCKDIFFVDEQEFRIVLPYESIKEGTAYPVHIDEKIEVMDLDKFFSEY